METKLYPWQANAMKSLENWPDDDKMICVFPGRSYGKTRASQAIHRIDGNPYNNDPANLRIVDLRRMSDD